MDLWIRSQDREKITKVNSVNISEFQDSITICGSIDGINLFSLASYKTKERALEVLDEIQKKINMINLGHDFGSPMIDLNNPTYIYKMPKEQEIDYE